MNGLSVMKRTASTSSSILAVSSAITSLLGKPVIECGLQKSVDDFPGNGLAATIDQGALVRTGDFHLFRRGPRGLLQRNGLFIGRQPIMLRSVQRRKRLELVERAFLLEDLGISLDRDRCVEHAGNAAGRNLLRVR